MSGKSLSPHTFTHLTLDERIAIQTGLDQNLLLKDLARQIDKHVSSVAREIRRNRTCRLPARYNDNIHNTCVHRKDCRLKNVCPQKGCQRRCSTCHRCNRFCSKFVKETCQVWLHFPFVCNGCSRKKGCRKEKYFYSGAVADAKSRDLLKSSRAGINLSQQQVLDLDLLLTPLIQKGQPISISLRPIKVNCPVPNAPFIATSTKASWRPETSTCGAKSPASPGKRTNARCQILPTAKTVPMPISWSLPATIPPGRLLKWIPSSAVSAAKPC